MAGKIDPHPWQTDTSIADWFYDRNLPYRPTSWVVHMLVGVVSKNGKPCDCTPARRLRARLKLVPHP